MKGLGSREVHAEKWPVLPLARDNKFSAKQKRGEVRQRGKRKWHLEQGSEPTERSQFPH